MATEKKSWVKDLLVAFAATTLSIILTFGTTGIINRVKQKQDRKLTALMVMSSIEQFARDLEFLEKDYAYRDSIATWLLSLPVEKVGKIDDVSFDDSSTCSTRTSCRSCTSRVPSALPATSPPSPT